MERYIVFHNSIWQNKRFRQLDDSGQKLYLAAMSSPLSNMLGYYAWPLCYALVDLGGWSEEKFAHYMSELERLGLAKYDFDNEVVFITEFLHHNRVTGAKQITGAAVRIAEAPMSPLFAEFIEAWDKFIDTPYRSRTKGGSEDALRALDAVHAEMERRAGEIPTKNTLSDGEISEKNTVSIPMAYPMHRVSESEIQGKKGYTYSMQGYSENEKYPMQGVSIPHAYTDTNTNTETNTDTATASAAEAAFAECGVQAAEAASESEAEAKPEREAKAEEPERVPDEAPPDIATMPRVINIWNDMLAPLGFPEAAKSTPKREKAFRARLAERAERRKIEWWRERIAQLAESPFMCQAAREKRGWLTLDWLLKEDNIVKVQEGKYADSSVHRESAPQSYEEAASAYYASLYGEG